ncbi:flagellar biosynthesis protein FlhF [Alteromonas sp. ASW11-36]|uniref:Flagellar biosynthesis protein FlhF n=1 Tax=Alteromonas arenosi TaxID=3055817 RepID=A0ABT7SV95_9ALTE|nr:flagellar biosynthesis protein FlhF [Alteromonas sp. ASW11-36]MDM7860111.1 flagellar biosynthesis protein FlhF [Alteromonas sp. ASW11-36]
MKIRRFVGIDMREALRKVKDELGADAVIMSTRKTSEGIELTAAFDKEQPNARVKAEPSISVKPTPTLSEIIGDSGPDSLRQLLEQQQAQASKPAGEPAIAKPSVKRPAPAEHYSHTSHNDNSAKPDDRQVSVTPSDLQDVKEELASLRNVLSFQVAALSQQQKQAKNPLHGYLHHQLQAMGITPALCDQFISYLPSDADEREAWLALLKLMANRLHIEGHQLLSQSGVVAMVGPTGAGKTTTVAKLAARYAQKYGAEHVAMVTIDTYRIAAYEQLSTYGKIIGCVVKKAQSGEELADVLYQLRHKKMILIDTAGFSQRDARLIGQLRDFSTGINMPINYYLVAQANAQYASLQGVVEAYKNVKIQGCIFTKLDECYSLGEMLSIAIAYNLPLSFITDGQKVPEDIATANGKNLISLAARLYKKYKLHHTSNHIAANAARAV